MDSTSIEAVVASDRRHILAEGPVWLPGTGSLLWVDIERGEVLEGALEGDHIRITATLGFGETVGAAVKAADGTLLVAARTALLVVSPDGERMPGPGIIADGRPRRLNDGKVDPAGRFLIGTLSDSDGQNDEQLVRVEDDGSLTVLDDDLALSNGLAWSPDGSKFYSIDTDPGTVWVRDYDAARGTVGPRRHHLHIDGGHPDGMCIDSRGHLWIAIWGAGEVRSFAPDGAPGPVVSVAAPHVSSVAFVGEHLDRLVITTASRDLTDAELETHPYAGHLFIADVGVTGLLSAPWSASWVPPVVAPR